jgi:hypothetical protein
MRWMGLMVLLWSLPAAALADEADEVLARLPCEPSIQQTQRAALRAWALDEETSLGARSRLAALLPQVEVRAGWKDSALDEERFREDLYLDPDAHALRQDGSQNTSRGQTQQTRDVSVRLRLELGRLVFDPRELQAQREERAADGQREKLLERVTQLYYTRRKSQVALLLLAPGQLERRLELILSIERDGALLDALTGGWFSHQREVGR